MFAIIYTPIFDAGMVTRLQAASLKEAVLSFGLFKFRWDRERQRPECVVFRF